MAGMTRAGAVAAVLGAIAAGSYAVYANRALEARLAESEATLAALRAEALACESARRAERTTLEARARACETPAAGAGETGAVEVSRDLTATPDARRGPTPAEREAAVRAHLFERLAAAFPDDRLSPDEQREAVDLLMEIRALRALQRGHGLDARMPPDRRDALLDAQYELEALTGMGVSELLLAMDAEASRRIQRPGDAAPPIDGATRKRFADEAARILGIAEPGSVERLDGDRWVEDDG